MRVISAHTSIENDSPSYGVTQVNHDVMVELENKLYTVVVAAKDTLDAAEKIMNMNKEEFLEFVRTHSHRIDI